MEEIKRLEKEIISLYNSIEPLEELVWKKDEQLINLWKVYNLKRNKGV